VKLSVEGLDFGPSIGFIAMTMLQLTRYSVEQFMAQKIDY
jgi:hypothetical protein